jgi:hypothetical protein
MEIEIKIRIKIKSPNSFSTFDFQPGRAETMLQFNAEAEP